MSAQIFPPEILYLFLDELGSAIDPQSRAALLACTLVNRQLYHQASPYIFSSLSISTRRSENRLNALLDILNTNPDIARHIRSFTVELQDYSSECVSAILRQLSHLQKFGWIHISYALQPSTTASSSFVGNLCNLSSLTSLHLEEIRDFPLSLFSTYLHLESLTLIDVGLVKIVGPETLSGALFSSLKRLKMSGIPLSDVEAVRTIMICAAPTLTSLILCNTWRTNPSFFLNLNSTVFPVLESITMSCTLYQREDLNTVPTFILQFLDYSAPMVNQIRIECASEVRHVIHHQLLTFGLGRGWLPIDKILSSPKYPALKIFDLDFSGRCHPLNLESEVRVRREIRMLLNEILPAVSSCSRIRMTIRPRNIPPDSHIGIQFNF